jgi:hypothetical protein
MSLRQIHAKIEQSRKPIKKQLNIGDLSAVGKLLPLALCGQM